METESKGLSKDDREEILELRKAGWTITKIAHRFSVSETAIRYHLSPEFRERARKRAVIHRKKKLMNPEYRKAYREYNTTYIRERYNTDEEFKERCRKSHKKYREANKERIGKRKRQYYRVKTLMEKSGKKGFEIEQFDWGWVGKKGDEVKGYCKICKEFPCKHGRL